MPLSTEIPDTNPVLMSNPSSVKKLENNNAIEVNNLSKEFSSENGSTSVLKNISFQVAEGEFVAVFGPNGCGKSSLINILGGIHNEFSGSVEIYSAPPDVSIIGHVFQNYKDSLFPWLNLLDNVTFGLKMLDVDKKTRDEKGMVLLEEMGLSEFHKHYPYQISGGMKQKVSIARALIGEFKLLLLDEPFSALDQDMTYKLTSNFLELWESKPVTTVLISHDIENAILLSDKLMLLSPRPATIIKIIEIPLPRPRNLNMLVEPEFIEIRKEILSIGRKEGALF